MALSPLEPAPLAAPRAVATSRPAVVGDSAAATAPTAMGGVIIVSQTRAVMTMVMVILPAAAAMTTADPTATHHARMTTAVAIVSLRFPPPYQPRPLRGSPSSLCS